MEAHWFWWCLHGESHPCNIVLKDVWRPNSVLASQAGGVFVPGTHTGLSVHLNIFFWKFWKLQVIYFSGR